MVPRSPEPAREHIRNALAIVRLTLETAEPTIGNEGPGLIVAGDVLGAIQARLEAALDELDPPPSILPFPDPQGGTHE